MIQRQNGFSMVELMITMVVFVFVIASASQIFSGLLGQFKQQSRMAETNIEGIVGLDILRRDIEHGGYGLPWDLNGAAYREVGDVAVTTWVDRDFSDGPPTNPERGTCPNASPLICNPADPASNPPAAFRSGNNLGTGGSDVLVIKATNVRQDDAVHKWTYVNPGNTLKEWSSLREDMITNDRVIVLISDDIRRLVVNGGRFTSRYDVNGGNPRLIDLSSASGAADDLFAPSDETETRIVYGVTDPANIPNPLIPVNTALRMPFNRADYYIRPSYCRDNTTNATTTTVCIDQSDCSSSQYCDFPPRCAPGTRVLYKGVVRQTELASGVPTDFFDEALLLDCVADLQVVYRLDADNNGTIETDSEDLDDLTAAQIRDQLREVRVYILAHEGQKDPNFSFSNYQTGIACSTCIRVGMSAALGRDFNLTTITDHQNYRWKVYTIAVQPANLR